MATILHCISAYYWHLQVSNLCLISFPRTRIGLMISPEIRKRLGMLDVVEEDVAVASEDEALSNWSHEDDIFNFSKFLFSARTKFAKLHFLVGRANILKHYFAEIFYFVSSSISSEIKYFTCLTLLEIPPYNIQFTRMQTINFCLKELAHCCFLSGWNG